MARYNCGVAPDSLVPDLFNKWCPTMNKCCRLDCMHIYKDGTTTASLIDQDGDTCIYEIPDFACKLEPVLHCYH